MPHYSGFSEPPHLHNEPSREVLFAYFEVYQGLIRLLFPNHAASRFFHSTPDRIHGKTLQELGFSQEITSEWLHRFWDCYLLGNPQQFSFQTRVSIPGLHLQAELLFLGLDPPDRFFFSMSGRIPFKLGASPVTFPGKDSLRNPLTSPEQLHLLVSDENSREKRFLTHELNNFHQAIFANHALLENAFKSIYPLLDRLYKESGDFLVGGIPFTEFRQRAPQAFQAIVEGSRGLVSFLKDQTERSGSYSLRERKPVDIMNLLRETVSLLAPVLQQATTKFNLDLPLRLPVVQADRLRLTQVLINLLRNACWSLDSPEEAISLSAHWLPRKRAVSIVIEDGGKGIPHQNIKKVFDPTFTTTSSNGGLGVGLAICSRIIELHGGTITLESSTQAHAHGTRVTVSLPIDIPNDPEKIRISGEKP